MKLKIDNKEEIISYIRTDNDKTKIKKLNTLYCYEGNKKPIFNLSINYVLVNNNLNGSDTYNQDIFVIDNNLANSEILITTNENFEVKYVVKYGNYNYKNILIDININVYKRPHNGWNFRLYDNINFSILNNGENKLWI